MALETGNMRPFGIAPPQEQDVVDEKTVNTAVSVLEGMHEDEAIGDRGGMDDGRYRAFFHHPVGGEQALHQFGKIVGLRADIMNELLLVGNRLPDVILVCPVVGIPESGIDDAVLHVDQERLFAKVLVLGHLQQDR